MRSTAKPKARFQFAAFHKALEIVAKRATSGQLVSCTAAKHARQIASANRPKDFRSCIHFGEARQIEQDICGRMPAANDEHALPGIRRPVAAQHVRNPVGDPIGERDFTLRRLCRMPLQD